MTISTIQMTNPAITTDHPVHCDKIDEMPKFCHSEKGSIYESRLLTHHIYLEKLGRLRLKKRILLVR